MEIDNFQVSEDCRAKLKSAAFTSVEEIVEFLDNHWGAFPIESQWILSNCFEEILDQMKIIGIRLKHEGENWDGTIA